MTLAHMKTWFMVSLSYYWEKVIVPIIASSYRSLYLMCLSGAYSARCGTLYLCPFKGTQSTTCIICLRNSLENITCFYSSLNFILDFISSVKKKLITYFHDIYSKCQFLENEIIGPKNQIDSNTRVSLQVLTIFCIFKAKVDIIFQKKTPKQ